MGLPSSPERTRALLQAVLETPDRPEPYLVLSDWLQSLGDPQGALIALQSQNQSIDAHLKTHRAALLGSAQRYSAHLELKWRLGFIRWASLRVHGAALAALLEQRVAQLLDTLVLDELPAHSWGPCLARLDAPPALLSHLALLNTGAAFDEVLQSVLQSPVLPQLQSLDLSGGRISQRSVRRLLSHRKRLRHLKRLVLRPAKDSLIDLGPLQDIASNVWI